VRGGARGWSLSETDVVIVGGGPAGAAAAIVSTQAGLSVKVFDRPRPESTHTYDAVHPGLFPLLDRLGVAEEVSQAGFTRHAGHWVASESERHFFPFGNDAAGPWLGAQLYRPLFDRILLNRARNLGAEVCESGVEDALTRESQVCGVRTRHGQAQSKYVLDATGRWRWLARRLRLSTLLASPPMSARYGIVNTDDLTCDGSPVLTNDCRGWTWSAPVGERDYWRIRLALSDQTCRAKRAREDSHDLRGLKHGTDVTWSLTEPMAGQGYFIVGDASVILDPASSHGILRAIMSGMMAAHLVVQIVHRGIDPRLGAGWYSRWMQDWFARDASRLRELYRGLRPQSSWAMAEWPAPRRLNRNGVGSGAPEDAQQQTSRNRTDAGGYIDAG
jgi:flavin-dependent dehydrogenase